MNEEDKKRFARYRPGYIEPPEPEPEPQENIKGHLSVKTTVESTKPAINKLGYVDSMELNPDDLINQVIQEMDSNPKPLNISSLPPNIAAFAAPLLEAKKQSSIAKGNPCA